MCFPSFCPISLGTQERAAAAPKPRECFLRGTARISTLASGEQSGTKLLWWVRRKQNERRCRAQGFRPKLCQRKEARMKKEQNPSSAPSRDQNRTQNRQLRVSNNSHLF